MVLTPCEYAVIEAVIMVTLCYLYETNTLGVCLHRRSSDSDSGARSMKQPPWEYALVDAVLIMTAVPP